MAEITASMVKELRERTDAPMMDCKKALNEANGDMQAAEEILRVKFGSKAAKSAGRVAAEGIVGIHITNDGKTGSIIEVNCETDFVAKNDDFQALVKNLAEMVVGQNPADVATLSGMKIGDKTVEEIRTELVGKIGENMSLRRFQRVAATGSLFNYIHGGAKIGVLLDISGGDEQLGKDIAMHIAASKPKALDASGVDPELIESERRVAAQKAAESGKPANIVEKMVEGSVQKFLKEVTLLNQPFVKDDKQTVEQVLKSKGAAVNGFILYIVGEGIEKKVSDFAAEVAAASKV